LLRPHGVNISQMNILTVVTLRGPIQPIEVARVLSLEKSTLSRNVVIMEANGWVESRAGDSGNTRSLRTTPMGRQLLKNAAPAWQRAQDRITALLGETTTVALRKAVTRFRKAESNQTSLFSAVELQLQLSDAQETHNER
jgi:DNA-binding MarR family transcriptional regulator